MNFKECNTCETILTLRNKVKNRCICKKCFKVQKAEYDKKRNKRGDRKIIPTLFTHKCKFCLDEFKTYKHDKEFCSQECKTRYTNAARRVRRRNAK
jgi:hypothetical protein